MSCDRRCFDDNDYDLNHEFNSCENCDGRDDGHTKESFRDTYGDDNYNIDEEA